MSLYKRPDTENWWCKFVVNGRSIRKSTGTSDKERAEEFEAKLRASIYDQSRLGIKPRYTWEQAVVRYLSEHSDKVASTKRDELSTLRWLHPHLMNCHIDEIDRVKLDKIINSKLAESVKPRTANAVTKLIRLVLRKAMLDWEWLDRLPKFRILKEPTRRVRWVTRAEANNLLTELPLHLKRMAEFSLETGLRRANVTHLRWAQVDLINRRAWIHPDEAKSRTAIAVPLTPTAIQIIRDCLGDHQEFIFVFKGKPVTQTASTAWVKACARAGIKDFRWHDLRHTWASWHIQDGTPLHILQELGGWESVEMVRKYAHLSTEHLDDFIQNRAAKNTVSGTGNK